jgi:hypothetical protein
VTESAYPKGILKDISPSDIIERIAVRERFDSSESKGIASAIPESRHIKTNCDDDLKSPEFAVAHFKEYLKKREDWYIKIHGRSALTQTEFTFKKTDVHRWKDGYLKKRLARLYKLREWFENQPSREVTMITLTVPHNENTWGKKVNTGHNVFQAWNNLKQGWNRLRPCKVLRDREFVIFYEPHKTGYPHSHLMVFGTPFTDEETQHLKELWSEMTGADLLNGVEVRPGVGVKHLIAYLMKYISKTLYHTIEEWTPGEWLFNAIAHEERWRLFGSSNTLAEVMRLTTDSPGVVECLDVSLGGHKPRYDGDRVLTSEIWSNPEIKLYHPEIIPYNPVSTADRASAFKLKNNIKDRPLRFSAPGHQKISQNVQNTLAGNFERASHDGCKFTIPCQKCALMMECGV